MATHTYGILEIDEARYLANLIGIEHDLRSTVEWCGKYDELFNSRKLMLFAEPLTSAILVRFMRAFGGGIRNTAARHLLESLTDEQKKQYEYYYFYRDKHIAHSINEFEENYVKAYYIEEDIDKGINSISTGCSSLIGLSSNDTKIIVNICNKLLSVLKVEMDAEKEKLLDIARKYTTDEILSLRMESPKHPRDIDVSKHRK